MKVIKILAILIVVYVGIVVLFESLLGWVQPSGGGTIVITTYDPDGTAHDRVVSRIDHEGKLYIAANHWPRAWYHRVIANPKISVTPEGGAKAESILYLRVADIAAAHDALKVRGVKFTHAPHMIHRHADGTEEWMAFFEDLDGRPLALMSQVKMGSDPIS